MDIEALRLLGADQRFRELNRYVPPLALIRAVGVARDELVHSHLLATLLDPRCHRGAVTMLGVLLREIAGVAGLEGHLAEPLGAKVTFEAGRIRIEREELEAEDLSEERILNTSDRVLLALDAGARFPEDFYSQSVWGVEMSTVKNAISKLRKGGLVRDTGNTAKRSREIELTEAGRKYVDEYLANRAQAILHHDHSPP